MENVTQNLEVTPVLITDDFTEMADYVRTTEGRLAIERGLTDIREGRVIDGRGALATELGRRAGERRHA